VAREWEMLSYAFERLNSELEPGVLAFLMPWIREPVNEWVDANTYPRDQRYRPSKARMNIDRDIKAILSGRTPSRFPRMTEELNALCLSGRKLFAQFRLLESSYKSGDLTMPPITIERGSNLTPLWVQEHLNSVIEEWKEDEEKFRQQKLRKAETRWDEGK
jgi:hypothetical protein